MGRIRDGLPVLFLYGNQKEPDIPALDRYTSGRLDAGFDANRFRYGRAIFVDPHAARAAALADAEVRHRTIHAQDGMIPFGDGGGCHVILKDKSVTVDGCVMWLCKSHASKWRYRGQPSAAEDWAREILLAKNSPSSL